MSVPFPCATGGQIMLKRVDESAGPGQEQIKMLTASSCPVACHGTDGRGYQRTGRTRTRGLMCGIANAATRTRVRTWVLEVGRWLSAADSGRVGLCRIEMRPCRRGKAGGGRQRRCAGVVDGHGPRVNVPPTGRLRSESVACLM